MPENKSAAELSRILRSQNAIVIPMVASKYSMPGVCDKYVCHRYWRGWLECKMPGESLRPAQVDFIKMVVERGDNACVVWFTEPLTINAYKLLADHIVHTEFACTAQTLLRILEEWHRCLYDRSKL